MHTTPQISCRQEDFIAWIVMGMNHESTTFNQNWNVSSWNGNPPPHLPKNSRWSHQYADYANHFLELVGCYIGGIQASWWDSMPPCRNCNSPFSKNALVNCILLDDNACLAWPEQKAFPFSVENLWMGILETSPYSPDLAPVISIFWAHEKLPRWSLFQW